MKTTLSVKETAEFLGISEQAVRIGLQRKIFNFGTAIGTLSKTRPNFMTYSYHIPIKKVEDYMGLNYNEWLMEKEKNKD